MFVIFENVDVYTVFIYESFVIHEVVYVNCYKVNDRY